MTVAWRRATIDGAGVSIDQHPDWAVGDGEGIAYQRGAGGETVSIRWGPGATIDDALAHVGLGSAGSTRTIEEDTPATIAGLRGRRVRLLVTGPEAIPAGGAPLPAPDREVVFVYVGFTNGETPVLAGYRISAAAPEADASLLEHVLNSIRPA
jgi:hypothetical protein